MSNPATTADIESRWRSLTADETPVAETRLEDAWRLLKRKVADLETRMSTDADLEASAIQVLADAVIRLLRVGDMAGYKRATVALDDASRSFELADDVSTGSLYFTDEELESLSSSGNTFRGRAYSVIPS